MQRIKVWYFASPLLFAVFNVLFLYSGNIDLVDAKDMVRSLLFVLGATFLILLMSTAIFKEKGPLLSVFGLSFVFFFGHVERLLKPLANELTLHIVKQLWLVLFFVAFILIVVKIRKIENLMKIITFVLMVMIGVTLTNIVVFNFKSREFEDGMGQIETVGSKIDTSRLPDIYYIILDAYARGDILKELYDYDNTEFLNFLKQKGFYVPEKSVSNYDCTILTLASSLNLSHLHSLADMVGRKNESQTPLRKAVLDNRIQPIFKKIGYTTVGLYSDCGYANLAYSDIFFWDRRTPSMTEFETILYNTTIFSYLDNILTSVGPRKDLYVNHKNRILYSLERLGKIPEMTKPTFTFSHIACPHAPFIFEANGEMSKTEQEYPFSFVDNTAYLDERKVDSKEYQKRYRRQLVYFNELVKEMINEILSKSDIPPIIILQADHGPGSEFNILDYSGNKNFKERFAIFSAFYFPDGGDKMLYNNISSVNVFPLILNYYFKGNFPLLEDKSYYSTWNNPYDFIDITKELE